MPRTVHRLAHAGSHRAGEARSCLLSEVAHSPLAHRHIEALVGDSLAVAGHTVVIDRMADSPAEERSNSEGTGCMDQT